MNPNTKTAAHTPGPWVHEGTYVYSPGEHGGMICQISEPRASTIVSHKAPELGSPDLQEAFANALLIAEAPNLLRDLQAILPLAEAYLKHAPSSPENAKLEDARATILKATGA